MKVRKVPSSMRTGMETTRTRSGSLSTSYTVGSRPSRSTACHSCCWALWKGLDRWAIAVSTFIGTASYVRARETAGRDGMGCSRLYINGDRDSSWNPYRPSNRARYGVYLPRLPRHGFIDFRAGQRYAGARTDRRV